MATKSSKPKKVSEARSVYKTAPRNRILVKCKKTLAQTYGERLKGVILYGSMARKNSTPSSDMDLLVLLAPPVDYFCGIAKPGGHAVSRSTRVETPDFRKARLSQ